MPAGSATVSITLTGYNATLHEFVLEAGAELTLHQMLISLLKLR
ncbi:MAG: hypothetical protein O7I93_11520 [Gemmatimonadetes bacterium]|nr:hypothetical protein [Gemmatimonadota bacterium]